VESVNIGNHYAGSGKLDFDYGDEEADFEKTSV
jgi:hypothetical protein